MEPPATRLTAQGREAPTAPQPVILTVEALNFRCLKYARQDLCGFQVLAGPNASGKTTFLEVIRFLGRLASAGLDAVLADQARVEDLCWRHRGDHFELALELAIPPAPRQALQGAEYDRCRYEVRVGIDPATAEPAILAERVALLGGVREPPVQGSMFPPPLLPPDTILTARARDTKTVVNKVPGGNNHFYDETGKGWDHSFKLSPRKSALANLPEDASKFPVSTWLKEMLVGGIRTLAPDRDRLQAPSAPAGGAVRDDGSNLPWLVEDLNARAPERAGAWVERLRAVLPDLEAVCTAERPLDRHRYVVLRYRGGLAVPAWMASEGTLRLLALTLPAYRPDPHGVYLVEEPENGLDPRAVRLLVAVLESAAGVQILLATHSELIVALTPAGHVLCFARSADGATEITPGEGHSSPRGGMAENDAPCGAGVPG